MWEKTKRLVSALLANYGQTSFIFLLLKIQWPVPPIMHDTAPVYHSLQIEFKLPRALQFLSHAFLIEMF